MQNRWFNPSQPQTLQTATILLYFNAAWALLFGLVGGGVYGQVSLITLLGVAGAYGMANDKKWGWVLSLVVAVVPFALSVLAFLNFGGFNATANTNFLIRVMLQGVLVVLLLHPMTRDYRKIWFR